MKNQLTNKREMSGIVQRIDSYQANPRLCDLTFPLTFNFEEARYGKTRRMTISFHNLYNRLRLSMLSVSVFRAGAL